MIIVQYVHGLHACEIRYRMSLSIIIIDTISAMLFWPGNYLTSTLPPSLPPSILPSIFDDLSLPPTVVLAEKLLSSDSNSIEIGRHQLLTILQYHTILQCTYIDLWAGVAHPIRRVTDNGLVYPLSCCNTIYVTPCYHRLPLSPPVPALPLFGPWVADIFSYHPSPFSAPVCPCRSLVADHSVTSGMQYLYKQRPLSYNKCIFVPFDNRWCLTKRRLIQKNRGLQTFAKCLFFM